MKTFTCDKCKESFVEKKQLVNHLHSVHEPNMELFCQICQKLFKNKVSLENHHNFIHLGLRPFSSEVCSKSFALKDQLSKHIETHTKKKAFTCEICGKAFKQHYNISRHMKLIHTTPPLLNLMHKSRNKGKKRIEQIITQISFNNLHNSSN